MPQSASLLLDQAASARPDPEALRIQAETAALYPGNPSAIHPEGKRAATRLAECRRTLLDHLGGTAGILVFTSGGTESNGTVLSSLIRRPGAPGEIIVSAVEHPSVYEPVQRAAALGWTVRTLPVDSCGRIKTGKLAALLGEKTRLVSIMAVNNETGAIQPITEAAQQVADFSRDLGKPVHFHCDAVQAAGKTSLPPLDTWGPDSVAFSAHKLGAPRGIGMLWLKKEIPVIAMGGGQESGLRPGTENLAGIAAMTDVFIRRYHPDPRHAEVCASLLNRLSAIEGLKILPESRLSAPELFAPQIICAALPPVPGEVMVRVLGEAGFMISTGSACSSRKQEKTRTLEAMEISRTLAHTSVRISPGYELTDTDAERFAAALEREYHRMRKELS